VRSWRCHSCGDVHKSAQQLLFAARNRVDRRRRDARHCRDHVHLGGEETFLKNSRRAASRIACRVASAYSSRRVLFRRIVFLRPFSFGITPLPSSQDSFLAGVQLQSLCAAPNTALQVRRTEHICRTATCVGSDPTSTGRRPAASPARVGACHDDARCRHYSSGSRVADGPTCRASRSRHGRDLTGGWRRPHGIRATQCGGYGGREVRLRCSGPRPKRRQHGR
jgi:hypothetical protein